MIYKVKADSSVTEKVNSATMSLNSEIPEHLKKIWEDTRSVLSTPQQAMLREHLQELQGVFAK